MVDSKLWKPILHPTLECSKGKSPGLAKQLALAHRQGLAAADVADLGLTRVCSYPLGISPHGPITLNSQYFLPAEHRAAPLCYSADYT